MTKVEIKAALAKMNKKEKAEFLALLELKDQAVAKRDYRFYFQNYLKIRDKNSMIVAFNTNPSQDKLIKIVEDWQAKYADPLTRPTLYVIILKSRQIGFSTVTEGIFFHDLNFSKDMVAMIVSYDEDSAVNIADMASRFYQYLPQNIKPETRPYRGKGILFENPNFNPGGPITGKNQPGLQNKFLIETARNMYAGSSYTIMRLHISELAKWPNPEETMTSLMQAVPDYGAIVVVESTANGLEYFSELWGKAECGDNNFKFVFIPWFDHGDYRLEFVSDGEHKRFEDNLGSMGKKDGINYRDMMKVYPIELEQVAWYRRTLQDKCGGDVNKILQEYPSCSEEAFISSGTPVFDNQKVLNRKKLLERVYKETPPLVGNIECKHNASGDPIKGTEKFIEDVNGWLTVYRKPEKGKPYVIGGDIAEGGKDWSTGPVLDNTTGEQVAMFRAHTDTDIYAKQMFSLGYFYNYALIAIEVNFDSHPVKELTRLGYHRQYKREVVDSISNKREQKYGFRTTTSTRPLIIGELVAIARDEIELINNIETLGEMLTFIRNKDGKPEAQSGKNDDCVLGIAIGHKARGQQRYSRKGEEGLTFPAGTPEEVKDAVRLNLQFEQKYNEELAKYRVKV